MREVVYEQLARVEDRLWWHECRRRLVRSVLTRLPIPPNAVALDVGCGTGGALPLLAEFATRVIGLDRSEHALSRARRKHPEADLRLGDGNDVAEAFAEASFDLVALFNVLYHAWIEDDARMLSHVRGILKPGGLVIITDAAFRCLFRRHDRLDYGKRRYRLGQMRSLLEQAGFEWVNGTYFNMSCFPLAWVLARWDRVRTTDDADTPIGELALPPRSINAGMKLLMDLERGLIRLFGRLPLGVSLLCVARRPAIAQLETEQTPAPKRPINLAETLAPDGTNDHGDNRSNPSQSGSACQAQARV